MTTKRREQVIRLAELLEIDVEPGTGTAEVMELCIAEIESQQAEKHETAMDRAEAEERAAEQQSGRVVRAVALLSVAPAVQPAPEQAFKLEASVPKRRRRRAA